jgi:putative ABC transport system permease protein
MSWVLLSLPVLLILILWSTFTPVGRETWSVTRIGIATVPQRLGSSTVVVVGIAGVVGVLVALLAMGAGFEQILKQTGSDDAVMILHAGAESEATSTLDPDTVAVISQAPQVLRDGEGRPVASAEQLLVASLPTRNNGLDASIAMRGVGESVWAMSRPIRITQGRRFTPGMRELIVGKGTRDEFLGLNVGSTVSFDGQSWPIVGVFDSGDAHNSEVWGDAKVIGSSYRRGGSVNSLTLRLTDAKAFDALKVGIESDPRLKVNVQTTQQYYSRQSQSIAQIVGIVGTTIGAIMAIGAIFGALNTTYAAVADRAREIATLRAIGFHGGPVILSVLLETMLLAALGGAVGATLTWVMFDGFTASTVGANSSQVVFAFDVSRELLADGLKWALAIGFIGGLLPAIRAARLPIVMGLREL